MYHCYQCHAVYAPGEQAEQQALNFCKSCQKHLAAPWMDAAAQLDANVATCCCCLHGQKASMTVCRDHGHMWRWNAGLRHQQLIATLPSAVYTCAEGMLMAYRARDGT